MITQRVLVQVLDAIDYHPGRCTGFKYEFHGGDFLIQHWQSLPDMCGGDQPDSLTMQKGRKWYISRHMCLSELVQTCFEAIKTFEIHEVREHFRYKGSKCFGPHIDIAALSQACVVKDKRDEVIPFKFGIPLESNP